LDGPLIGTAGQPRTLIAAAMLPKLDWLIGVHVGALIALAAVIVIWAALPFTVWGFKLRATTGNADAARFAGIKVDRVMVSVGLISGALAGLAGAIELAGTLGQVTPGFGAGTGYAGIAVAVLAGRSFPGVVIAAVFIAALQTGADALPRDGTHVGDVLVALTLACAVIASMLVRLQVRRPQPDRVVP